MVAGDARELEFAGVKVVLQKSAAPEHFVERTDRGRCRKGGDGFSPAMFTPSIEPFRLDRISEQPFAPIVRVTIR